MKPETFESCNLVWFPLTLDTVKPDWLPEDARVRILTESERSGVDEYDPYIGYTGERLFDEDDYPLDIWVGWYPADEAIVPAASGEPLKLTGTTQTPRKAVGVMSRDEMLAEVARWLEDQNIVSNGNYQGAAKFVNWYYDQCEDKEGGIQR